MGVAGGQASWRCEKGWGFVVFHGGPAESCRSRDTRCEFMRIHGGAPPVRRPGGVHGSNSEPPERSGRSKDGPAGRQCSDVRRSEEHTSELQSLMRISYAVFCLK